ncbi:MAG: glycosyltransferase family 9 protein [Planctomycetes bacterium]|nr:glycosyltransferase family 9 protein [Planctomycetota bacterium]
MSVDRSQNRADDWGMTEPSERSILQRHRRRYRVADTAAALVDAMLAVIERSTRRAIPRPRKILLANFGHLGDIVMSTPCLSILRKAFPEATIGFLIGSWARPVLEGHPDISRLHVVDHWFMDRGPESRFVKAPRYWRDCLRVAREIERERYDVAIDLRAYKPNAIPVLRLANIPVRIGYTKVGFGPLLTHPRRFVYRRAHETVVQSDLLEALGVSQAEREDAAFHLPLSESGLAEARRVLGDTSGPYRVVHAGASVAVRDWPVESWRALVERLTREGRRLVFTGRGPRDRAIVEHIATGLSNCINACDALSWAGLVEMIRGAELVYSVETAAGHVAVAVGSPVVAIYGGMQDWRHWAPRAGPGSVCLSNVVPCWPCFTYNGCGDEKCLKGIGVVDVYRAGEALVSK